LFFALFSVLRAIAEWKPGEVPKYGLTEQMVVSASHAKILGATIADKFLFSHGVPLHAKAVILCAVIVSMVTTYLTVRQSMKRGMMPAATPDNPMGQSQKYMAYIMPFFALTGLYWPFGLVLYWVTTNVWTLGQQWALFKRYPWTPPTADGAGTASAATGAAVSKAPPKAGAGPRTGAKSSSTGTSPNGRATVANGSGTGGSAGQGSGMLRKLGRRSEPEPQPEEPEVKLVRQQRQRQSRSKRSGKR
jgi:YidC/Oxa1 family membrane protein insertase